MSTPPKASLLLERLMYASRWLLAPIYLGLSLGLLALFIKFFQEVVHIAPLIFQMEESQLLLKVLSLIDLSLVGSLLVVVMFSSYENFVSRMNISESTEKLEWLGTHDYGSLKMKIASSLVAISSIHLLEVFMDIEKIENTKIMLYALVHLTFVISALFMGYLDKLSKHA
jgi:uncharacterized protein (TIGR00645 family)